MVKYWYRRILIMIVVFTIATGGCWYLMEERRIALKEEVSARTSGNTMVIPGGMPVGIYLETDGIMVLGTESITGEDGMPHNPAEHLVKPGDYIVAFNGQEMSHKTQLIDAVQHLTDEEVVLTVRRSEEKFDIRFKPVKCGMEEYKLGIWVRDNTQGLGTITFLNEDSRFGALGHGIHDMDTSELLNISDGTLYITSIKDIQKGESGMPGGMEGIIVYNHHNMLGTITKNTEVGIFGTVDRIDRLFSEQKPMETGIKEEIEVGAAVVRCAVDGEIKEYDIEITGIDYYTSEANKGLTIEVTDEELLLKTGGIVQGMSGAPIIQNGKLVGAVTHVFVNNPTKGYGIFIENMLKEARN